MATNDNDNDSKYCLSFADVQAAAVRLEGVAHRTPVYQSTSMNRAMAHPGAAVYFKVEALQRTGSFKFRGAYNAVQCVLQDSEGPLGVVTHSSGNHAAALALAARLAATAERPVTATIVMPHTTPAIKQQAVVDLGATVVMVPPAERAPTAARIVADTGATLIHPSEDPRVMAGQGTVCLEMLQQIDEMTSRSTDGSNPPLLDAVIIPVGGGGLAAGNLITLRAMLGPHVQIILAEPAALDDAHRSFAAGRLLGHAPGHPLDSVADGLKTALGPNTWPVIRDLADAILTVSEADILQATKFIWERLKICIEPSAGVGVAVLLSEEFQHQFGKDGLRVGVILCGGNVDVTAVAAKMQQACGV